MAPSWRKRSILLRCDVPRSRQPLGALGANRAAWRHRSSGHWPTVPAENDRVAKAAKAPLYLTASMRVLRAHQHRPALTAQDAHDAVKELALRLVGGTATREDQVLEERLKKATGVTAGELAQFDSSGRTGRRLYFGKYRSSCPSTASMRRFATTRISGARKRPRRAGSAGPGPNESSLGPPTQSPPGRICLGDHC